MESVLTVISSAIQPRLRKLKLTARPGPTDGTNPIYSSHMDAAGLKSDVSLIPASGGALNSMAEEGRIGELVRISLVVFAFGG